VSGGGREGAQKLTRKKRLFVIGPRAYRGKVVNKGELGQGWDQGKDQD
jgi:hypothetical protein